MTESSILGFGQIRILTFKFQILVWALKWAKTTFFEQVGLHNLMANVSIFIGKLKVSIYWSRRAQFRWFDNRSRELDEIYRIWFDHISRYWSRNGTKNTKPESWESGETNFEDANPWGFVHLESWRFRKSLESVGLLFWKSPFRPPSEGRGAKRTFQKIGFSLNSPFKFCRRTDGRTHGRTDARTDGHYYFCQPHMKMTLFDAFPFSL